MDDAAAHRLQYVGEAIPSTTAIEQFPPHIRQIIQGASKTALALEQMIDVLRKRALRKCILGHAGAALDRTMKPERMDGLHVASPARASGDGSYTLPHGDTFGVSEPLVHALLAELMQAWPQSMPVADLIARADASQRPQVASALLQMLQIGLVEVDAHPPACTRTVSRRAMASSLARMQAMRDAAVTHLRHGQVTLPPLHRELIQKLDGLRSPAELADGLKLDVQPGTTREQVIEAALSDLAQNALIMS